MRIFSILLILQFVAHLPAAGETEPNTQYANIYKDIPYYLFVPKSFPSQSQEKFPILIGIHYFGGNGNMPFNRYYFFAKERRYILICPTFPDGYQKLEHETAIKLKGIIDKVISENPVDESKIFITGLSGGAQFAHRFVFTYPNLIKGAALLSAGDYDKRIPEGITTQFFVGVGELDRKRARLAKPFVKQLERAGYPVEFKTYPELEHDISAEEIKNVKQFFERLRGS